MMVDATILDVIRLITGTSLLAYASYTDMKTRRAANILWVIMGLIGAILLVIQYLDGGFPNIWYLVFVPIMIVLMYLFFQMRLLFGGADAKALMALAILVPIQPLMGMFPLWKSFLPGSWTIFANATILFLFIPISLLIYNSSKRNLRFPHCMLGYVTSIEKAKQKYVWPLEKIKDGKRKLMYMPKNFDIDEELAQFEKLGITEIWVTPKIPFMVPLLAGFLFSFILGDILLQIVSVLL
ncbi:MAG TPA: A24 family peptidase C-terminal domain-containing protein [Candidatus Thermoplasmatota archaeon]|nr:A24 family peptidase C-terminal domain-containing protein [Candidatus Thermoplasmatota archaeon]